MSQIEPEIKPVNELWSAEQAAAFLHKAPSTIRKWVKQRRIPFVKIGGENLFDPASLREWAGSRRFEPTEPTEGAA